MTSKIKIILSGISLTIIIIIIFLIFRIDTIEKNYINRITKTSNAILNTYRLFDEKTGNEKNRIQELNELLNIINKKYKNIALVAIANLDYKIQLFSKNNKFIKNEKLYENIIRDFTNQKLTIPTNKSYAVRYYNSNIKNKSEKKYYIFNNLINNDRILIIFPYQPGNKNIVRIFFEICLIVLILIILTSAVYIISEKKKIVLVKTDKDISTDSSTAESVDLKSLKRSIKENSSSITEDTKNIVSDSLDSHVYKIFKKLNDKFSPESVELYLKTSEDVLSKSFKLKGKSFLKIDSTTFDIMNINNDIGTELKKSSIMVMDNGSKTIIPIIYENSLLGIISIIRNLNFSGEEINSIKSELHSISKELSDYIVVNRVMIDDKTGLYSNTYFKIKYNEQLNAEKTKNKSFSILLVSLIDKNIILEDLQKNSLIKLLSNTIKEKLNCDNYICKYDDMLGIILPDNNKTEAYKAAEGIFKVLSKYRVKIQKDLIIQINPFIGLSSSDSITDNRDILEIALGNINSAMSKEKGNIQV